MSPSTKPIIVVRNGDERALFVLPPSMFAERSDDVGYFHVSAGVRLPVAEHYFFVCQRPCDRIYQLLADASKSGATVTLVVRHLDDLLASLVEQSPINLIPTFGPPDQITWATLGRTIAMVLAGHRIVANGFLLNSLGRTITASTQSTFIKLLIEASADANRSSTVVTAVLTLQRTGSKFLRDIIGLTVSGNVRLFHEHSIPKPNSVEPDDARPALEQILIETDLKRKRALKRSILRRNLLSAERRYVFVCERDPGERLISHFQIAHAKELGASFNAQQQSFTNEPNIQAAFDAWATEQVELQRGWYQQQLAEPFGLRVLETERTVDGLFIGQSGPNKLLIVPTARLNRLLADVSSVFGAESYASLADNSARSRGNEVLNQCFRKHFTIAESVLDALRRIPEVAYIHS